MCAKRCCHHLIPHLQALLIDLLASILNLVLPGEENQDVAWRFIYVNLHHCANRCLKIVSLWLLSVEDLDRVQPARHLH